ncbi:MAG: NTP transferase domain-containing protein, partial [Planctomycetes bacterium]|nr:NTP transferase domain-containing protein [Planctomycetota bacterium]
VFLCAVDCPFLQAAFVARMFALLGAHDAAVPRVARRVHPLSGCYRAALRPVVERLLAAGRRDILALLDEVDTRFAGARALRAADARLASLVNVNTPEDYREALLRLGEARA